MEGGNDGRFHVEGGDPAGVSVGKQAGDPSDPAVNFSGRGKRGKNAAVFAVLRYFLIAVLSAILCFSLGRLALLLGEWGRDADAAPGGSRVLVVIDAGHGGEDGGASGADGTLEKDINLELSRSIRDILSASGVGVIMTRNDDRLLYDAYGDLSDYKGKKKVYDLRNRLRIAEEHPEAVLLSIHMNAFSGKQYSGLQVYYSPNDASSSTLAGLVQSTVRRYVQPDNDRETKRAGSSIYLLNRLKSPGILVECGFLSNVVECQHLNDPAYRQSLALAIASGVMEFLAGSKEP